jgi:hypothetical protein
MPSGLQIASQIGHSQAANSHNETAQDTITYIPVRP